MTTITFNTLNPAALRTQPSVNMPNIGQHSAWFARATEILSGAALAAVPFTAIGWMFIAH